MVQDPKFPTDTAAPIPNPIQPFFRACLPEQENIKGG
jgi:hypothetical protein